MPALLPAAAAAALPPGLALPLSLSLAAGRTPEGRDRSGPAADPGVDRMAGPGVGRTDDPEGAGAGAPHETPERSPRRRARLSARRSSGKDARRRPDRPANARPHQPVLLDRVLHYLAPRPGGRYLDATFGRGGHSEAILEAAATSPTRPAIAGSADPDLRGAALLALDRDPAALPAAAALAEAHPGFRFVRRDFADLDAILDEIGWARLDGILLDLGLSSPQLDGPTPPPPGDPTDREPDPAARGERTGDREPGDREPGSARPGERGRGFSFQRDEPLDMRFDPESGGETAAELLDRLEEREIADLLHGAGERRSRAVARRIAARRPLRTTGDLRAAVIAATGPRRGRLDPATRTFLAVRRAVNREAEALDAILAAAPERLAPGGALVVIAYHSDEDRPVKHRFRELAAAPRSADPAADRNAEPEYEVVTRRPERPDAAECDANRRARSARLRVLRRRPEADPTRTPGGAR